MNGERVYSAGKLARERFVDHSMTIEPALSFEGFRYDIQFVVSFAAGPMARVPGMEVRLIRNLEACGGKCPH